MWVKCKVGRGQKERERGGKRWKEDGREWAKRRRLTLLPGRALGRALGT